jgi:hypothetical protein
MAMEALRNLTTQSAGIAQWMLMVAGEPKNTNTNGQRETKVELAENSNAYSFRRTVPNIARASTRKQARSHRPQKSSMR